VQVDDALIGAGILRIDVYELRLSEITITGDPGPHLATLERLGSALRDDGPLRQRDMQTTLRRMRELPGLTLSATTAPDPSQPHVYRLDFDTEFEPLTGTVQLSNRGTEEAGPNFVLGQVVANGLLAGDTNLGLQFGAATDYDEYHGLGIVANVGMGEAGARASFLGFRSRSNPHEPVIDRDDLYLRDRVTIGLSRPLPGVTNATVALSAALRLDDLAIYRSATRLRDERLRMLELRSNWSWRRNSSTQYATSLDVVKGLGGLGSGLTALDLVDDSRREDFLVTHFNLTRLTRFNERWSIRLDTFVQQSAYVLPYDQRFKIGGDRLGRGFEVAEIAGDQGLGAKVEVRRRLPTAPAVLGRASIHGFYDIGAAWKQDVPGRESAATAGVGFAIQSGRVSGTLELAQPLTHADVEGSKGLTLFVELVISL
jgi:hemolysin activation/secretion protein